MTLVRSCLLSLSILAAGCSEEEPSTPPPPPPPPPPPAPAPAPAPVPAPAAPVDTEEDLHTCASFSVVSEPRAPLPDALSNAGEDLGTHRVEPDHPVEIGNLRLWSGVHFVPLRLGSSEGTNEGFLRGAILPDYEQPQRLLDVYSHQGMSGDDSAYVARVRGHRYRALSQDREGFTVGVERTACNDTEQLPPLEADQTLHYWLSTHGTTTLNFARERFDFSGSHVVLRVFPDDTATESLDSEELLWGAKIEVAARPDRAETHTLNRRHPDYQGDLAAGAFETHIERVELGEDTRFEAGSWYVTTDGIAPTIHVLVRVTRAAAAAPPG